MYEIADTKSVVYRRNEMAEEMKQGEAVDPQPKAPAPATDPVPSSDDKSKAEIAGLNRKIAEMQKAIDAEKKAKMTEQERSQAERAELEALKAETMKAKLNFEMGRRLVKKNLPTELADLVQNPPKDEDELDEYLTKIEGLFKAHASSELENFRKANARTTPEPGGNTKVMLREDFKKLTPSERTKFMSEGGKLKD